MKILTTLSMISLLLSTSIKPQDASKPPQEAIRYEASATKEGQLTVKETIMIKAPIRAVWEAYTTSEGYASWAAPVAKVDLRPGGTILSAYEGGLDGDHVNTLHIVNYVPERLLTLQADVSTNWPKVLKKDAENLYNVILFDELGPGSTKVTSYGLGYTDSPALRNLMTFFEKANRGLYRKLITTLEADR